jgi:sulfur-carrier protein
MATLRLFASAREVAGTGRTTIDAGSVGEVLERAVEMFGPGFADVLSTCRVWLNGEVASPATTVGENDEVAVLPPVSGGASDEEGRWPTSVT